MPPTSPVLPNLDMPERGVRLFASGNVNGPLQGLWENLFYYRSMVANSAATITQQIHAPSINYPFQGSIHCGSPGATF
jgi:hypothetical protein